MKPMSEDEAWQALMGIENLSLAREDHRAKRLDGGWVFLWRQWDDISTLWTGISSWVITDTGEIDGVGLGETPEKTIERLKRS